MAKKAEALPTPEHQLKALEEMPETINITFKRVGKNAMVPRVAGPEGHIDGREFHADTTWSGGYYLEIAGQRYVIGPMDCARQMYEQLVQPEA